MRHLKLAIGLALFLGVSSFGVAVVCPTTTTVSSSQNFPKPNQNVRFVARVKTTGCGKPTGKVTFWDSSTSLIKLGEGRLDGDGDVEITSDDLVFTKFTQYVMAIYNGDSKHSASQSSGVPEFVQDPYILLTSIQVPGNIQGGTDISWVDPVVHRFYTTDHGNPTATPPVGPAIDVIDTLSLTYLYSIPNLANGNGLVSINRADEGGKAELWMGDNNSNFEVFDPITKASLAVINTGGNQRMDELAYDPKREIILGCNDNDTPTPFCTFVDVKTRTILKKLFFPQVVFGTPSTDHGIEQSVWNPTTDSFYLALPGTASNPNGEVDQISDVTFSVVRSLPTKCVSPMGLVDIPSDSPGSHGQGDRLFTSCGDFINVANGLVITTVPGINGDETWYNIHDETLEVGGGPNRLGFQVVDSEAQTFVVEEDLGPARVVTHSVAADDKTGLIFVPVTLGKATPTGVQVWIRNGPVDDDDDHGGRDRR